MNNNLHEKNKGYRTIIKASAGTGKTYRLSLEYIANVLKGVNYENIVVMTFTKKATAEIKSRIFEFIENISLEKNNYIELKKNIEEIYGIKEINIEKLKSVYKEMLKNKEELRIYTLDGFCNQIFKNAIAPYLGMYNYIINDSNEDTLYENIFINIIRNDEYKESFEFVFKELKENRNISVYLDFIKKIVENRDKFILSNDTSLKKINSKSNFIHHFNNIYEILKEIVNQKNDSIEKAVKKIYQQVFKIINNNMINPNWTDSQKDKINTDYIINNFGLFFKGEFWNKTYVKKSEYFEELVETYEKFIQELSNYLYDTKIIDNHEKIIYLEKIINKITRDIKSTSKELTHSDISNYTYEFIYNKELDFIKNDRVTDSFLELIGGKIETVMIDEFQDTSILQWEILKLMINAAKNIICVGDEKQSIYSWRGGEKELFVKLDELINANVEKLNKSYRSYKEVISNTNNIFTNINKEFEYFDVDYRKEEKYEKGFFGYHIKEHISKISADYVENESAIEEIVRYIIEGKVNDLGNSVIIARNNNQLSAIAERLNEENIPYTLNSNSTLINHKGINAIYKLIKYLTYDNYIYFLEFLRSDLINLTNNEISIIIDNREDITLYFRNKINKLKIENKYILDILQRVKELKSLSYVISKFNLTLDEEKNDFSKRIINSFGLLEKYNTKTDLKNIFFFYNIVKNHDSLAILVDYIEEKSEKLQQLSSQDSDAINLMTIHKSKGLEYETVFYYHKSSNKKNNSDMINFLYSFDDTYTDMEIFLIYFDKYQKILEYTEFKKVIEKNEKNKIQEELNTQYVAVTRAAKNIIIGIDASKTKEGIKDNLAKTLLKLYNDNIEYTLGEIEKDKVDNVKSNKKNDLNILEYFGETEIEYVKGIKENTKLSNEYKRKKGSAVHYYLEQLTNDLEKETTLAKSSLYTRYGNLLGKDMMNEVIDKVEKFILNNKEIYSKKYKVYNEFEVINPEGEKRVVDRINIDEDNKIIYIYDYKTGFEPENNEKYTEQLLEYKKVLLEKTNGIYEIETKILEI